MGGLGDDQTSGDPLKVGQKAGQADGPPLVASGESGTLLKAGGKSVALHKTNNKGRTLQEAWWQRQDLLGGQPRNRAAGLEVSDMRAEPEVSGARETGGC